MRCIGKLRKVDFRYLQDEELADLLNSYFLRDQFDRIAMIASIGESPFYKTYPAHFTILQIVDTYTD